MSSTAASSSLLGLSIRVLWSCSDDDPTAVSLHSHTRIQVGSNNCRPPSVVKKHSFCQTIACRL